MTGQILWFFDNTFTNPTVQNNIGPFNPGVVDRIFRAEVSGELSYTSTTITHPFTTTSDLVWGLQWVAHGGSPQAILTSTPSSQWLWRQNVGSRTDITHVFAPSSATGVSQVDASLAMSYSSQGNRPGSNIDVYLSVQAGFGVITIPILLIGSINFFFD